MTSPLDPITHITSTESANTETNSASTSKLRSWSTPWEKSSIACAGSARGPEPETLAEIGDPHRFANPGRLASYAGLAPVNWQSGTSATPPENPEAATTDSKTPCSKQPSSPPNTIPTARAYYQQKRAQKANATTQPSPASPPNAATSSWPCSKPKPPTNQHNTNPYPKPPKKT